MQVRVTKRKEEATSCIKIGSIAARSLKHPAAVYKGTQTSSFRTCEIREGFGRTAELFETVKKSSHREIEAVHALSV